MENQQPEVTVTEAALPLPPKKKESSLKELLFDNLSPVFAPFDSSKNIYVLTGIAIIWLSVFGYFWSGADVMIPGPTKVFTALYGFVTDLEFYQDIIQSLKLTCEAMLLSIVVSCMFAYLSVTKFFQPIAHFLVKMRFMSLMGFIFTFTLIIGAGGQVKIALLMFGIIPFFTLSLLSVIDKIPRKEYDLWTTLKFNRWERLWHIIIRGRADATIEAIRANFAMGWLMITLVESFSMSEGGIGVMLFRFNKYNQLDKIFALQIVILFLGIVFDYLLKQARYAAFPHIKLAEKK